MTVESAALPQREIVHLKRKAPHRSAAPISSRGGEPPGLWTGRPEQARIDELAAGQKPAKLGEKTIAAEAAMAMLVAILRMRILVWRFIESSWMGPGSNG